MPNFKSVDNQYAIGAVSENFPVMTTPGCAFYEIPHTETYDGLTRFDDYRDGGELNNVNLSHLLKGVVLGTTGLSEFFPFSRMNPEDFVINTGNWIEAYPPDVVMQASPDINGSSCLFLYDQTLNESNISPGEVTYKGTLVAAPTIQICIDRCLTPPYGMTKESRQWEFSFGNGFMLQFGIGPDVYLYYNDAIIGHHYINGDESQTKWANATLLRFRISNPYGDIVIECDNFDTWTVKYVGVIPSAPYSMYTAGGLMAFNLTQASYELMGWFITDPIQLWQNYNDEDLIPATFPPNNLQPPDTIFGGTCTVSMEVYDSPTTTTKRFQVTLRGDGFHTPTVQAFQWQFPPQYAIPSENWLDFTEWVIDATIESSTESTTLSRIGPVMRQATLQVRPDMIVNGKTLWEWLGISPTGDYAIRIKTGMVYDDETFSQSSRITGSLTTNSGNFPVGGVPTKTWSIHDRWERFSRTALLWSPCVAGLTADQAISTIAQWAGVAPSQIDVIIQYPGYTFPILTEPAGDPTKLYGDWTQPTWYPKNGTNAAEFIKQIAERFGLIVAFNGEGRLEICSGLNTTYMLAFSRDPGAAMFAAVENVEEQEDRQSCINTVVVQGKDQYGRPIFSCMYDIDSLAVPGTPLYVGYPVVELIADDNLNTQAAINFACAQHYWARKAGFPTRKFPSHTNSGWLISPNQLVTLENTLANHEAAEVIRITHTAEHYPGHLHSYTIELTGEVLVIDDFGSGSGVGNG